MADEAATATDDAKSEETKENEETTATEDTDKGSEAAAGDEKLGEAGVKALEAFKDRARTAEKEARELRDRVKEFEDATKSEQEKKDEALKSAEDRATKAEAKLERVEVAIAKKLPLELAGRLQGSSKKELEADADRLLELVKPKGSGDADGGKGEADEGSSFNDQLREKAGLK